MPIALTEEQAAAIRAHGAESYPHECCGFLIGRSDGDHKQVAELWRVENAREEEAKRRRYLIAPEEVLGAEKRAREEGVEILGVYHSHPDHPAKPSETDREFAWPFFSYIIVEVQGGKPKETRSWLLTEDRTRFESEEIRIDNGRE